MNALINRLSDEKFKYGKNDCFTFTAALVKAWHGKDYLPLHRGYRSERAARDYLEQHGGIEALTTGTLGYAVDPTRCRDGDVVTAEVRPGEIALGFVFDDRAYFKTKTRVVVASLERCRKGWRVESA